MSRQQTSIDAELEDWNNIKDRYEWKGLLVGNGASLAIWEGFNYKSLYKTAIHDITHPLSREDRGIFKSLRTRNFERTLAALWTAEVVSNSLGQSHTKIHERYKNVQRALIEAVHAVHVEWSSELDSALKEIHTMLLLYESVYTTNYDLLLYWAVMSGGNPSHKDYFWSYGHYFDISNAQTSDGARRILYLHGALHLFMEPFEGRVRKLTAARENLLSQFDIFVKDDKLPLFISEGTTEDKLSAIRSSDYLSFAYEQFANHKGNLVIFGHSLDENDQHLLDAMKKWTSCSAIAISMQSNDKIRKARISKELKGLDIDILFYSAKTHPLGSPALRIT